MGPPCLAPWRSLFAPPPRQVSYGRHWGLRFVAGSWLYNIFYRTSLHTISESCFPGGLTLGSPSALPQASDQQPKTTREGLPLGPRAGQSRKGLEGSASTCLRAPVGHHPSDQERRHVSTTGVRTLSPRWGVDVPKVAAAWNWCSSLWLALAGRPFLPLSIHTQGQGPSPTCLGP